MAIHTGQQKFNDAFFQSAPNEWTLRTGNEADLSLGAFDIPLTCKFIRQQQTLLVDTFLYYTDDSEMDLLKKIVVTYTDAEKEDIVTVQVILA